MNHWGQKKLQMTLSQIERFFIFNYSNIIPDSIKLLKKTSGLILLTGPEPLEASVPQGKPLVSVGKLERSVVASTVTAFGVLWAMLILSETYSAWIWAAMILILSGVFLVQPRAPDPLADAAETGKMRVE